MTEKLYIHDQALKSIDKCKSDNVVAKGGL